ncbi:MAG: SsrA-binding protein [Candidatus Doudnabacteria bacterium Gr01-1014_77]|uniref:SsrA-binding protein n=1 Tax=Candidatus Doudnabacteria bacterium Gr01-1014_77 TaxID=2017133 RepID=A0A554JB76_9BACT|nr:MAG: SsrA-binding protein [Candidatus Doudnabacteria bacterium Gr01-1014_77]
MKILINNRKASFDYAISDEMVAGLVLSGSEVKSLKAGQASLKGAYISIRTNPKPEAFLVKAHITPYKYAGNAKNADPEKDRKLLLNKHEINSLIGKEKGTTIIPLEIFVGRKGLVKIKIGIGKGKKKYDKRSSIKKREVERRIKRQED